MADDEDKKEEEDFKFDSAGEERGYISLEQARVLAVRHARENTDFYGPEYSDLPLTYRVVGEEEGEDYYYIRLSYRPAGRFRGEPGVEQFTIDKTGPIEIREVLSEPSPRRGLPLTFAAVIGLVAVAAIAVGALFAAGAFAGGDDGGPPASAQLPPGPTATATSPPEPTPVPSPPLAPVAAVAPGLTSTPIATATRTPVPTATATPPATPTLAPMPTPVVIVVTATRGPTTTATKTQALASMPTLTATPPLSSTVTPSDNGRIAFVSDRTGRDEIYVMNTDGTSQMLLTNINEFRGARYPAWSSDGRKLAFSAKNNIYVMDSDGGSLTELSDSPNDRDLQPSWSPDGRKIAFSFLVNRQGEEFDVYAMDPDGSNRTRLTTSSGHDQSPAWSPDGTKIAFESDREDNWEIYVMNPDGTGQTRLTNNPTSDERHPVWSSDGRRIAFESNRDGGNPEIYVMDADGSNQTRLTNNPASDEWPSWSPDDGRIAFTTDRDGNKEIYVMDSDGGNKVNLTNSPSMDWMPAWASMPTAGFEQVAPTPSPTPSPTPTSTLTQTLAPTVTSTVTPVPITQEEANMEYQMVITAIDAMMRDNNISTLPNPSNVPSPGGVGGCKGGTNDMSTFPDTSPISSGDKAFDPSGTAYTNGIDPLGDKDGYVLFDHDITADNQQNTATLVNYTTVKTTRLCYKIRIADGEVQQYTEGGHPHKPVGLKPSRDGRCPVFRRRELLIPYVPSPTLAESGQSNA